MIRDLRSWLPRLGGSRCGERRKQGGGPGAEPADGEEECPGGTLGHDGGPLTPKSAPGAAEGRAGKEKPTHDLFPSKMVKTGGEAGADDGGAHDKGATSGTPGGETLHATRPAPSE